MKSFSITLLLFCTTVAMHAQNKDTVNQYNSKSASSEEYISLLTGYNGGTYHFIELGVSVNRYSIVGTHPISMAYFISNEIKLDNKIVIGPKVGLWAAGGAAGTGIGLNLIYYTDFDNSSLRLRPEVGIGPGPFKIAYGYNIALTNKSFERINTHNASLVVFWKLKKLQPTYHQ